MRYDNNYEYILNKLLVLVSNVYEARNNNTGWNSQLQKLTSFGCKLDLKLFESPDYTNNNLSKDDIKKHEFILVCFKNSIKICNIIEISRSIILTNNTHEESRNHLNSLSYYVDLIFSNLSDIILNYRREVYDSLHRDDPRYLPLQ